MSDIEIYIRMSKSQPDDWIKYFDLK